MTRTREEIRTAARERDLYAYELQASGKTHAQVAEMLGVTRSRAGQRIAIGARIAKARAAPHAH